MSADLLQFPPVITISSDHAEERGFEIGHCLLEALLESDSQADAVSTASLAFRTAFNLADSSFTDRTADGMAVALVDVLMAGIEAIRGRSS